MPEEMNRLGLETTAHQAQLVRDVIPANVIAEAAKTPALQSGQIHDRVLGGLIGGFIAYACTHVPGHELTMDQGQALALGAAAGNLGTMVGAKVPEAYRSWLQAIAALAAVLFGIGTSAPS